MALFPSQTERPTWKQFVIVLTRRKKQHKAHANIPRTTIKPKPLFFKWSKCTPINSPVRPSETVGRAEVSHLEQLTWRREQNEALRFDLRDVPFHFPVVCGEQIVQPLHIPKAGGKSTAARLSRRGRKPGSYGQGRIASPADFPSERHARRRIKRRMTAYRLIRGKNGVARQPRGSKGIFKEGAGASCSHLSQSTSPLR